jgi:hypothetical protein
MKLPSLYEFKINDESLNFLLDKLEFYKKNSIYWRNEENYSPANKVVTENGDHTDNLLDYDDDLVNFLESIKQDFEKKFEQKFELFWSHIIHYYPGGYQKFHKHDHNEDFGFLIYLNDCDGGETVFTLNEKRKTIKSIKPRKGNGIFFLASLGHYGDVCKTEKKVLFCGLKLKN